MNKTRALCEEGLGLTSSMALEKEPQRRVGSSVRMGRISADTACASASSFVTCLLSPRWAAKMACLLNFWTSAAKCDEGHISTKIKMVSVPQLMYRHCMHVM